MASVIQPDWGIEKLPLPENILTDIERLSIRSVGDLGILALLAVLAPGLGFDRLAEDIAVSIAVMECPFNPVHEVHRSVSIESVGPGSGPGAGRFERVDTVADLRFNFRKGSICSRVALRGDMTIESRSLNSLEDVTNIAKGIMDGVDKTAQACVNPATKDLRFLWSPFRLRLVGEALNLSAERADPKVRDVLIRRFGLRTGTPETLDSIGRDLGVTRERIRQIQSKGIERVSIHLSSGAVGSALKRFQAYLSEFLAHNSGVASSVELSEQVAHYIDFEQFDESAGLSFLVEIVGVRVRQLAQPESTWLAFSSHETEEGVRSAAEAALANVGPLRSVPIDELAVSVARRLELSEEMVRASLRVDPRIIVREDQTVQQRTSGRRLHHRDRIYAALGDIGRPAHFRTIARRIRETFGDAGPVSDESIENTLVAGVPTDFRRVGLGTYGLADWGLPVARDSMDLVCQIFESEMTWMSFQQVEVRLKKVGWRYRPSSVKLALDLEHERPNRRIRRIGKPGSYRYGLAWWHRDDV